MITIKDSAIEYIEKAIYDLYNDIERDYTRVINLSDHQLVDISYKKKYTMFGEAEFIIVNMAQDAENIFIAHGFGKELYNKEFSLSNNIEPDDLINEIIIELDYASSGLL